MLFLLFSPSQQLANAARQDLEHHLEQHGYGWLPSFVSRLSLLLGLGAISESIMAITILMALCCLSLSADCRKTLLENGVLDILIRAIKYRVLVFNNTSQSDYDTTHYFSRLHDKRFCCYCEDNRWEGKDPILFFLLWAFAIVARGSDILKAQCSSFKERVSKHEEWDVVPDMEIDRCFLFLASSLDVSMGVRWWASCCLSCYGAYGFPSRRSRIWKLFNESGSADIKLHFANGKHMYAHKIILATKCPALLPFSIPRDHASKEQSTRSLSVSEVNPLSDVQLSARIHEGPLKCLLEFVYKGIVFVEDEFLPEVKLLAKRCGMVAFLHLLQGKAPIWGNDPEILNFTSALGSMGCSFADIFFEDKDSLQVGCVPDKGDRGHQHAHRVILASHCSYFEGLFRSGMQDSLFKFLKIPLQSEALEQLLKYLYSMVLPRKHYPEAGCMFSLAPRPDQLKYLHNYVELAGLAELWLLEDLKNQCGSVILDFLQKNMHLGPDVMKHASLNQQWWLVEMVTRCIANDYPLMRESGQLDILDDYLVDKIRAAHVRISMSYGNR
ncbi:hypothetical protein KP509_1Z189000 [Ceratopteris richardii]|nr:hypothetical protein KP509_1Z189000 [Ceratopteris richardii]KAH6556301.1 hypothetical protein KP509_1Z189000 [Ceratopteris richardii]